MKHLLMIFMSVFMLMSCGTAEEKGAEEDVEAEDETAEEESEQGGAVEDEAGESGDERKTDRADIETASNVDFSVTEASLTDESGSEMTSMLELNSELVRMMNEASESEAEVGEVLKADEDLTTYYSEAFVAIHFFRQGASEPFNTEVEGLNAEMDVRGDIEAYSERYNTDTEEFEGYLYRNEEGYFSFDGSRWTDETEISPDEDIYYGSYENLYEAFMEAEDLINVYEDDDYYYLHNIGNEEVLHETFGTVFNVEFTGADESQMENAVVSSVDKSTGKMDELLYITTAPSVQGDEQIQIEVATSFDGYGAFDGEGVTVPDIEENESTSATESNIQRAPESVDFSMKEEKLIDDNETELISLLSMNAPVPAMLDNAAQADVEMEDILKPKDEITTYYGETFLALNVLGDMESETLQPETVGLIAEIDEGASLEVYSEIYDPVTDEFTADHYGNSDVVFEYHDGLWTENTSGAKTEEIFHATYTNLHDAFLEVEEEIEVAEDDEYYYLYNISDGMILHDVFGDLFEVEYTGADEEAMENAVIGIVKKSNGNLMHLAYISSAPAELTHEYIHIEIASSYGDYGAYDDRGITVPAIYE